MGLKLVRMAIVLAAVAALSACSDDATSGGAQPVEEANSPRTFKLYFFGGQSNMAGFGANAELFEKYKSPLSNVYVFHGETGDDNGPIAGDGSWALLSPGFGAGFDVDESENVYSRWFGPELTFGYRMAELEPESDIAIIKYVKGGTALQVGAAPGGTWNPDSNFGNGINQYDHFLATVRNALSQRDVDGDGTYDKIVPAGIVWLQGEGDASHVKATAQSYEVKLKHIIDLMRAAFRVDDLPVIIVQISDSGMDDDGKKMDYVDFVRAAQANFVARDSNAFLVKTDGYNFISDGWHFDTEAIVDLGKSIADEAHAISSAAQ